MPIIEVKAFDHRFADDEKALRLIAALTDAFVEVHGEEIRPEVEVILVPIPRRLWGFGGATRG